MATAVYAEVAEERRVFGAPALVVLVSWHDPDKGNGRGEGLLIVRGVTASFVTTSAEAQEAPAGCTVERVAFWAIDDGVAGPDSHREGWKVSSTAPARLHAARRAILDADPGACFYANCTTPREAAANWQRERGLRPFSWWVLPPAATEPRLRCGRCDREWEVRADDPLLLPAPDQSRPAPPALVASLDIETLYPVQPDSIFEVGLAYYLADGASDRAPLRVVVFLVEDERAEGRAEDHLAEVASARAARGRVHVLPELRSFPSEREMLRAVYADLEENRPTFVLGYNSHDFDINLMLHHIDPLTRQPDPARPRHEEIRAFPLSRLANEPGLGLAKAHTMQLASGEVPSYEFRGCFGVVFVDLLLWLRRTDQIRPEAGLSLASVSDHNNIGYSKDDVPYEQLHHFYPEARFRARTVYYVALDAALAAANAFVLGVLGIVRANSNAVGEQPHTLLNRGQKVFADAILSTYGRRGKPFLSPWRPSAH